MRCEGRWQLKEQYDAACKMGTNPKPSKAGQRTHTPTHSYSNTTRKKQKKKLCSNLYVTA